MICKIRSSLLKNKIRIGPYFIDPCVPLVFWVFVHRCTVTADAIYSTSTFTYNMAPAPVQSKWKDISVENI